MGENVRVVVTTYVSPYLMWIFETRRESNRRVYERNFAAAVHDKEVLSNITFNKVSNMLTH